MRGGCKIEDGELCEAEKGKPEKKERDERYRERRVGEGSKDRKEGARKRRRKEGEMQTKEREVE